MQGENQSLMLQCSLTNTEETFLAILTINSLFDTQLLKFKVFFLYNNKTIKHIHSDKALLVSARSSVSVELKKKTGTFSLYRTIK